MPYTQEDDDNLCWYMSRRIPNSEDGGRFSHGIWKELLTAVRSSSLAACICSNNWLIQAEFDESLGWAKRHSVQSWRERYRKRAARFDPIIAGYAMENPPEPTALYGRSRRCNKNNLGKGLIVMESEEGSDEEVAAQFPNQTLEKSIKTLQRQRAESYDESSSGVAKRKKIDAGISDQDHRGSSAFSPLLQALEPPQSQQSIRNPIAAYQADINLTSAVPSPTLVQRTSQAVRSSHSTRHVTGATDSSFHLSTSFRNVAHSSPALNSIGLPSTSGIIRSHHTSVTEPSSRSILVPTQLSHSPGNTANAPAEPSIARESSHKPSSPKSQPLSMMNAGRKLPSSRRSGFFSSDDEEDEQGTQWAPYKNTRSRSRSIEPVMQRKRGGRIAGRNKVARNELLEPVHESEVEQKQGSQSLVNMTVTETMQEEQNVADQLMPNPDADASGTRFHGSIGQTRGNDGNNSPSDDVKRTYRLEKSRREEYIQRILSSGKVQNIGNETALPAATESPEFELEDEEDDASESEGSPVRSLREDSELAMSSDDQATEQQFLSNPLSLLDSPADRRFQKQQPQTNSFRLQSPTPYRSQNRGYPTVQRSSQVADVHHRAPGMLVETALVKQIIKDTSDSSRSRGLSSTSSFIETRPSMSHVNTPPPAQGPSRHPSIQYLISAPRQSQGALESFTRSRRHASEESTSSE